MQEGWSRNGEPTLFVAYPYKFQTPIIDFNTEESRLDTAPSVSIKLKKISRSGDKLYVPVGKHTWQRLKDPKECLGLCMFWEKYMEEFAQILFNLEEKFDEEVTEVHFKYGNRTSSFHTDSDISQNLFSKQGAEGIVFVLSFSLEYRKISNYAISSLSEEIKREEQEVHEESEDDDNSRKYRPYIRFISTPMGGMSKWKR